ncbi:hypothetical protein L1049_027540 [Liquidambar formosana]|uniref:Uncharacterized protein n=1 Tax=Liquidambar formosana TaxID=63359 RepID=A0AAP0RIW6_LIQFO
MFYIVSQPNRSILNTICFPVKGSSSCSRARHNVPVIEPPIDEPTKENNGDEIEFEEGEEVDTCYKSSAALMDLFVSVVKTRPSVTEAIVHKFCVCKSSLLYTHSSHLLAKTILSPSNLLQTEYEFANPLTRGWLRVKFDELWRGAKNRMKRDFHDDELPLQLQCKDLPDHLDDNQ